MKYSYTRQQMEDIIDSGGGVIIPGKGVVVHKAHLPSEAEMLADSDDDDTRAAVLDHIRSQREALDRQEAILRSPPAGGRRLIDGPAGRVAVGGGQKPLPDDDDDEDDDLDDEPEVVAARREAERVGTSGPVGPDGLTDGQRRMRKAQEAAKVARERRKAEREAQSQPQSQQGQQPSIGGPPEGVSPVP